MKSVAKIVAIVFVASCTYEPREKLSVELRIAEYSPGPGLIPMKFNGGTVYVSPVVEFDSSDVKVARAEPDPKGMKDRWAVRIDLTSEAAARLEKVSKESVGKPLAALLDGHLVSAHEIRSPLSGHVYIRDDCGEEEAREIAEGINSGR